MTEANRPPTAIERLRNLTAAEGVLIEGIEYYTSNIVRYEIKRVIPEFQSDLNELQNKVDSLTKERDILIDQYVSTS